jgi:hypothetical protein
MTDDELREEFARRRAERARLRGIREWLDEQVSDVDRDLLTKVSQDRAAAKLLATSARAAGKPERERIGLDALALLEREHRS